MAQGLTIMRVRRVQEIEVLRLPAQLLAARKASDMSLLEICRQLSITPTYWYKLENGEAATISYDLLQKIENLLSLNFGVEFLNSSDIDLSKEKTMDLSRLKWIKVVTPGKDWEHPWALSPEEIKDCKEPLIRQNNLTIVPLGFKQKGSEELKSGDLIVLTQHAKITHVVEVVDNQYEDKGGWFQRYIKIVWWKPNMDWKNLPNGENVLGFNISIQSGIPYEFNAFTAFKERWGGDKDGLDAFREYLAKQLSLIS
jgi:transcriptional regulator with XRE-family HTH domain